MYSPCYQGARGFHKVGMEAAFHNLKMLRYFATLPTARLILWCYLVWYVCVITLYFDPSPMLWVSAMGMSGIIGLALLLSTTGPGSRPDGWTTFRLFLMPFCVSSYSALMKGKGFILIFPPAWKENVISLGCIAIFVARQWLMKSRLE
jgi:hypothetical protein